MGDMNISPTDLDIGIGEENRKRWLRTGKCSFLPEEREWMDRLLGWGLVDTWRQANPDNHEHFSWFDYRSKGFDDNRGLRIDLLLASQPLAQRCVETGIDYEIRGMETVRPRAGVGHLPAIIHALLSPPAVRGQNFLSKINKATVNHCDGRRNRILSRALLMSTASRLYRSTSHAKEAVIRPLVKGWDFSRWWPRWPLSATASVSTIC